MAAVAEAGCSYALLADGTTMTIRPAGPGDYEPVRQLHEDMSPDNLYFRFFSLSRAAAGREATRVCREAGLDHGALLGWLGDKLVGVASYEPTSDLWVAEIALAAADDMHGRGVATLLLEHLVSLARARGIKFFTADALASNSAVLRVLNDAGLAVRRRLEGDAVELVMPIPQSTALSEASPYLDAVAGREKHAGVASLEPLLAPRSVAVIGAGRHPGSVGRMILRNIRDAGFGGAVYVVSPHAGEIEGVRCVPSVAALPEPPDLAVVAVPAAGVLKVAQECGERGARSLLVITSGLTPAQESGLLAASRQAGMRLAGPGCFGVAVPGIGLDATFARHHPVAGLDRPGQPVRGSRRGGAGAAFPARARDLVLRLRRQHARCRRQRHADVVGGG